MRHASVLVALLALAASGAAQTTPDPTPPESYYPLAVGNEWVYLEDAGTVTHEAVVGDSVVAGETFAVVERTVVASTHGDAAQDTTRFLIRVDPATATVVTLGIDPRPLDACPLDADFRPRSGGPPVACGDVQAAVSGGPDQFVSLGYVADESVTATVKAFESSDGTRVAYAAGVGRTSSFRGRWPSGTGRVSEQLITAVVGGVSVGPVPTPDPTPAHQYYPLAVGNEWEYANTGLLASGADVGFTTRREVVKDTLAGGVHYFIEVTSQIDTPEAGWFGERRRVVRYDTASTRVVALVDGVEERVECRFGASFGEPVACGAEGSPAGVVAVSGGAHSIPFGKGTGTFGIGRPDGTLAVTSTKEFVPYGIADFTYYDYYAAPVGYAGATPGFCSTCARNLSFARVRLDDGSVYEVGERFAVAADGGPDAAPLALTVGPNPTAGLLAVTVDAPAPTAATVEVFDALGRRVDRRELALGAGRQRVTLDAGGWAPGLYVVRITTAGGGTAIARVVRR